MIVPELLYVPRPSDIAKAITVPIRVATQQIVTASSTVINIFTEAVPNDLVFVVVHTMTLASPGGAQTVVSYTLGIGVTSGPNTFMSFDSAQTSVLARQFQGNEVLLMPGENLVATVQFSSGVIANTASFSYIGYMFPRANWQAGVI